jgi:outer membrane protein assembly factor BamB
MKLCVPVLIVVAGRIVVGSTGGGDWPQFRYDANRSAASPEELPAELHLHWVREMPPPRPAFSNEVRLRFDGSYEPIVYDGMMFVPSMVTDSVTALEARTGNERWCFITGGPVRFAPVAWRGGVYFVADDGCLYCVAASDGTLRWRFQGLPPGAEDRKLLGNGRLISLWPARGGPVLADGVVYFAAGLWPSYGVGVYAVDAASGRVLWSNTGSNRIARANMDHGIAQYAGLTPQGYLAIVHDKLVVPCGAQLPAFLDRRTGALGPYCMGWGGRVGLPKGSWFVAGVKTYLSHSGDLYDISRTNEEQFRDARGRRDFKSNLYAGGFTRLRIEPNNQRALGAFREPVLTAEVMYDADDGIVAYDLAGGEITKRSRAEAPAYRRNDKFPDSVQGSFPRKWKLSSPHKVYIKAGSRLYLGGAGVVEAVALPGAGQEPKIVWRGAVKGTPHRMLAASGMLYVVTREGPIYAFGGENTSGVVTHALAAAPGPPADAWTEKASEILRATKVDGGYAVVFGLKAGRLVEELVRQSNLHVIALDRNPSTVGRLRRRLHRAGLYGSRCAVAVGDPVTYPLPPYLAQLVVSEDIELPGAPERRAAVEAMRHALRPYGGTACVALSTAAGKALKEMAAAGQVPELTVRGEGDWVLAIRPGALPGSADWTHEEADAGNSGASEDTAVTSSMGLLWFGGSIRWHRKPGSALVRVAGGRVLVKAQSLHAVDVYTGRHLWEAAIPFPHTPGDQLVAVEDAIYVTGGRTCFVLDPATGRQTGRIALPEGLTGAWASLRVWGGYLVGQSGEYLVCLNRRDGAKVWQYACREPRLSVVCGGGRVYCAELADKRRGERAAREAVTRALDVTTGALVWEIPGGAALRYSAPYDLLVTPAAVYRGEDGTIVTSLAPLAGDEIPPRGAVSRPLAVIGRELLWGTVDSFVLRDLETGDPVGEKTTWNRRGCTGLRASANLVTTRFRANAACVDLATRAITSFWNIRPGCHNALLPANGVFNMPNLTGGCECNYTPTSQAYVPLRVIHRVHQQAGSAGD